jgi:hypothetical protein
MALPAKDLHVFGWHKYCEIRLKSLIMTTLSRKIQLLLLLPFLFISSSYAQDFAYVEFEKTTHIFGQIQEVNGLVAHDFKFVNKGKVPFVIKEIKPSCGCTSPEYSREPVKPGKSGFVRVTFDPKNKEGAFVETIIIESNANGKLQLTIEGSVVPRPRTFIDDYPVVMGNMRFKVHHVVLGDIYRNSIDTGYIYAYNNSTKPLKITHFIAPEHIRGEITPIVIMPKQERTIQIFFSSYLMQNLGYNFDRIQMVTDDTENPEKEFVVVANVTNNYKEMTEDELKNSPKIEFDKTVHDFGTVNQGQVLTTEFKYKNSGKDQLVIYDTKAACGCTAMTLGRNRIEAGDESVIKVVYDTKGKKGKTSEVINIKTNDPNQPEVYIYIKADVKSIN